MVRFFLPSLYASNPLDQVFQYQNNQNYTLDSDRFNRLIRWVIQSHINVIGRPLNAFEMLGKVAVYLNNKGITIRVEKRLIQNNFNLYNLGGPHVKKILPIDKIERIYIGKNSVKKIFKEKDSEYISSEG